MKAILAPVVACLLTGQFAAPSLTVPPQPPFMPFDLQSPTDSEPEESKECDDE